MGKFDGRYPTSYAQARQQLDGKKKIALDGRSTILHEADRDQVSVQYHWTNIVTFHENGAVSLNSGGYWTKTTKDKINSCLTEGWHVIAVDYAWYLGRKGEIYAFRDGMQIMPDGAIMLDGARMPRLTSLKPHQIPSHLRA